MTDIKTDIARAIWSELREDLDKCDLEVEDLYKGDRLWVYADVAHAAAQQEIARLRAALVSAVSFVEHADVSSGVCCCGDSMKGHGDVFDTGHSPRDMWDYAAEGFIKETRALLDTK